MENDKLKIGVAGLGLIGGSILKALHNKGFYTVGISKSSFDKAKEFCNLASSDINDLKGCNVVFVCSKMAQTLSLLDELESVLAPDCVVTDVCSLKRFVNNKKRPYNFVSSHPMAGTEFSGFDASFAELFKGAKWVITKENKTLEKLIREMGATPVLIDETTHDKEACLISHLPMLLATALFKTVQEEDPKALRLASSGFRDTTRLSLTNPDLAYDMLNLNRDNFNVYVEKFVETLNKLKGMNEEEFRETLAPIQNLRNSLYDKNGKNGYDEKA